MKSSPRRLLPFGLALLTAFVIRPTNAAETPTRPNILFCFADDWGRYASCYAPTETRPSLNQVVKTPNIDRIAKAGVLFRNAHVGSPSCTPCRSALVSGRYFFNTGRASILNGAVWDPAIPSWPLMLRDSGYHLGKMYKVWGPGTPGDAPIGGQDHAYEKAGRTFNKFSTNVTQMVAAGTPVEEAKAKVLAQVGDNFSAFLADRKPGQPFCFWFGPTNTHRMWEKGSGKKLWGIEPEAVKGKLPAFLPDVPEVREDMADYLGEAQAYDAAIGLLLKKLEDAGELKNTIVVISGDHGMPGVPHGKCNLYDHGTAVGLMIAGPGVTGNRVVDDFVWIPDLAATFLEVGGLKNAEGMSARSLMPVLKSDKTGQVDPERSWVITGRERHVAAAREGDLPYPHRALRTGDFLYIRNFAPDRWPMGSPKDITDTTQPPEQELEKSTYAAFADMDSSPTKAWLILHRNDPQWRPIYDSAFAKRPPEELYDLRKDPDQMNNVATDPAYAAEIQRMSGKLIGKLTELGDPRLKEDGKFFETPPMAGPLDPSQQKGKGRKQGQPAPANE
jgi:arylsulfatase A-like enzyme